MNGDFVGHGIALEPRDGPFDKDKVSPTWNKMKTIFREDYKTIRKYYPNTDFLPTIGNNDVFVHNNVPCNQDLATMYYEELYDVWFNEYSFT